MTRPAPAVQAPAPASAPASAPATAPAAARQLQPAQTPPAGSGDRRAASGDAAPDPPHPPSHAKLPPVPDLDNRRFCRACGTTLPLESFPPGKRRYLCRRHTWLRVKKPSRERALADTRRRQLWVLWKRCWDDAKTTFQHPGVALVQRDIAAALAAPRCAAESLKSVREGPAVATALALVPANPAQPLSRNNLVVVANDARRRLLRAHRKGGEAEYAVALEQLGGAGG